MDSQPESETDLDERVDIPARGRELILRRAKYVTAYTKAAAILAAVCIWLFLPDTPQNIQWWAVLLATGTLSCFVAGLPFMMDWSSSLTSLRNLRLHHANLREGILTGTRISADPHADRLQYCIDGQWLDVGVDWLRSDMWLSPKRIRYFVSQHEGSRVRLVHIEPGEMIQIDYPEAEPATTTIEKMRIGDWNQLEAVIHRIPKYLAIAMTISLLAWVLLSLVTEFHIVTFLAVNGLFLALTLFIFALELWKTFILLGWNHHLTEKHILEGYPEELMVAGMYIDGRHSYDLYARLGGAWQRLFNSPYWIGREGTLPRIEGKIRIEHAVKGRVRKLIRCEYTCVDAVYRPVPTDPVVPSVREPEPVNQAGNWRRYRKKNLRRR